LTFFARAGLSLARPYRSFPTAHAKPPVVEKSQKKPGGIKGALTFQRSATGVRDPIHSDTHGALSGFSRLAVCQIPDPTMIKTATDEKIDPIANILGRAIRWIWARWCKRIQ
jgi:hypothetical protein